MDFTSVHEQKLHALPLGEINHMTVSFLLIFKDFLKCNLLIVQS